MQSLTTILSAFILIGSTIQNPTESDYVGTWENDDITLSVTVNSNEIAGYILKFSEWTEENPLDKKNKDPKKRNTPLKEVNLFKGFSFDSKTKSWNGGKLYDFETGEWEPCEISMKNSRLLVTKRFFSFHSAILSKKYEKNEKIVLIKGTNGMIGDHVLNHLLENDDVGKVISLGRRSINKLHPKIEELIHDDFLHFGSLSAQLTNIDICIYCIGVYQNQVSKYDFFEITCDYLEALSETLQIYSPQLTFLLFSANGASQDDTGSTYAVAKGKAERFLKSTSFPKKIIFKPRFINPTTKRRPSGIMYKILLPIVGMIFRLFPSIGVKDIDLARVMVNAGLDDEQDSSVIDKLSIQKMVNQPVWK